MVEANQQITPKSGKIAGSSNQSALTKKMAGVTGHFFYLLTFSARN
jgi:hypothetical protein